MRAWLLLLVVANHGCADLHHLEPGVCGNGVRDAGEDCDAFADPALGTATRCAPAEDHARACRYECASGAPCPTGWGCGDDGICRRASGTFGLASSVDMLSASLALGDVDGDGTPDVVGSVQGAIEVSFGDRRGGLEPGPFRHAPLAGADAPGLGNVDADGSIDLVSPTPEGLVVLRGTTERAFEPVAYAPYGLDASDEAWMLPIHAWGDDPGQSLLYLFETGRDVEALVVPVPYPGPDFVAASGIGQDLFRMGSLPERLPIANLDSDAPSEVVIAAAGDDEVVVLHTGKAPSIVNSDAVALVTEDHRFLVQGQIDAGALVAELDGVSPLDVLVGVNGTVHKRLGTGACAQDSRFVDVGFPLAAGDIDNDGLDDFVTRHGIYFASDEDLHRAYEAPAPWKEAVVADFNGDHLQDVAVISADTPGVELLLAQPPNAESFTPLPVATTRPPRLLRAGNFDGDPAQDLLFAEGYGDADELSILFGEASGPARERVRVGRFAPLERLEVGELSLRSTGNPDGASDIVASSFPDADGKRALAVVIGNSWRTPYSPLALQQENIAHEPLAVFAGRFLPADDNAPADVIAVATTPNDKVSFWLVPGTEGARYAYNSAAQYNVLEPYIHPACTFFTTGDLDADGADDVVALGPTGGCNDDGNDDALTLWTISADVSAMGPRLKHSATLVGKSSPALDGTIGDIDLDGALDLVVARRDHVAVYWGPTQEEASVVALSEVVSLALVHADADVRPEIAVFAAGGVFVVEANERVLVAQADPVVPLEGTRVRAADVNGDGLDDLVVGDGARVTVHVAEPLPAGAP